MPSVPAINPREVYEKNPDFTGHEEQFKLRPYEWEFYLRLDGRRAIQEICDASNLTLEVANPIVERLLEVGLARVVEISMEEFYNRFVPQPTAPDPVATTNVTEGTSADDADGKRFSFSLRRNGAAGGARPAPQPTTPAAPVALAAAPVSISIRSRAAMPLPALVPKSAKVEELHLKPLLDFVVGHSGGGTVGQLAVYRVFLKVPNELLRQAGIRSLNLVKEDFTIRDPELKRCLLGAVEEVLGRAYVPTSSSKGTIPSAA